MKIIDFFFGGIAAILLIFAAVYIAPLLPSINEWVFSFLAAVIICVPLLAIYSYISK